jgi:hypothetical protein
MPAGFNILPEPLFKDLIVSGRMLDIFDSGIIFINTDFGVAGEGRSMPLRVFVLTIWRLF